jgi:hypothetical protein
MVVEIRSDDGDESVSRCLAGLVEIGSTIAPKIHLPLFLIPSLA